MAGLVESILLDDRVTVELIGDGLHVAPSLMRLAFKVKGPDRVAIITDGSPLTGFARDGTIPGPRYRCRAGDHLSGRPVRLHRQRLHHGPVSARHGCQGGCVTLRCAAHGQSDSPHWWALPDARAAWSRARTEYRDPGRQPAGPTHDRAGQRAGHGAGAIEFAPGLRKRFREWYYEASMRILFITDLEGCAGIYHREIQISQPAPLEYARTLRICTLEVIAAVEGTRAAGATEILIDALHDIDLELLPAGLDVVRGKAWWDDRFLQQEPWDAQIFVGMHGGAHLTDCALAHTFLPSWQIEGTTGGAEGWARQIAPQLSTAAGTGEFSTVEKVWLNGTLVGEHQRPEVHGRQFQYHRLRGGRQPHLPGGRKLGACDGTGATASNRFRAARMLSPAGAQEAIRAGVERSLRRLSTIPAWAAAGGPQEVIVRYVHQARAAQGVTVPRARLLDSHTVTATLPDGKALSSTRFLFARPRTAEDPPTAEER